MDNTQHTPERANASLIAAAPDLLEALKGCLAGLQNPSAHPMAQKARFDRAKAAIAKAEGK